MTIGDRVRKLDIFKKVPQDFSEGTNRGGLLSILTVISVLYFLFVEVRDYANPEYGASIVTGKLVTRREMKYSPGHSGSTSTSSSPASPAKSSRWTSRTP
jgi:hypothetical protein